MDVKLVILILLNMAPPQKLVLAPGAIIKGNKVHQNKFTHAHYNIRRSFVQYSLQRNLFTFV